MKKNCADLHLCPDVRSAEQFSQLVDRASRLGYHLIAITLPAGFAEKELDDVRHICREARIDLASRIDLKPRTPEELIRNLRKFRRKFELVAVLCESKNVARQAAKDRRVDLLSFPWIDFRRRFFDAAEAQLASDSLASLEIDMKPLLVLEGPGRIRLLSCLRREVAIARRFHVPIVVSSGVSDEFLMRRPMEMASLASLFDLDQTSAVRGVSENPVAIVKRNRAKLSSRFIAPGIRVIRRGTDC